jgi:hypothetical protein
MPISKIVKKGLTTAAKRLKNKQTRDAIKRKEKKVSVKVGAKLDKFENSIKKKNKFKFALSEVKKLSKKKAIAQKNYKGFKPEEIQLSNYKENINKLYKKLRSLGKGQGTVIKDIPSAEKVLTKLKKQASGQKAEIKKEKKELFKNVKIIKSKGKKTKSKKRKVDLTPTSKKDRTRYTPEEFIKKAKERKYGFEKTLIGRQKGLEVRQDADILQRLLKGRTGSRLGDEVPPLMGKEREDALKKLKEYHSQFKKGGLIKRKTGGPIKPKGFGAARYKGSK